MKIDGCTSAESILGQSALLIHFMYIFPYGDLKIHGIIIASRINFYDSVLRLNELITKVVSDKSIIEKVVTISCNDSVFDLLCFINLTK